MSTLETAVRKTLDCPPWCTVNHAAGLARMEEEDYGERVHSVCVAIVTPDASVWVNRADNVSDGTPGPATVWAEVEYSDLNTEQSIQYAEAVMRAVAITKAAVA